MSEVLLYCTACGEPYTEGLAVCLNCGETVTAKPQTSHRRRHWLPVAAVLLFALVMTVLPWARAQYFYATASDQESQWAQDSAMSRQGKLLLYSNNPTTVVNLGDSCGETDAGGNFIDKGCYIADTHEILVREMPSDFYNDEVVTIAHEMLHVAYLRLDSAERDRVDGLLEAEVTKLHDPALTAMLAYYDKVEPGQRDNELHSIIGTEYGNLSGDLEAYYSQYFDNRMAVVALNQQTQAKFATLQAQLTELDNRITSQQTAAANYIAASNRAAYSGDASNTNYYYQLYTTAYNQYAASVDEYNNQLATYNLLVARYNGQSFSTIARQ